MPIAAVCLLLAVLPLPAAAQSAISSAETRSAQFVFVIDDSGSMSRRGHWGQAADPDRLAVFAVRSLINMLDPADEVSVMRLNGALEGEGAPPIEPLRANRERILGLLELDSRLAAYGGEATPCRSALDEVEGLLNAAYRPNVAQVVMLLTDGECTGSGNQTPNVNAVLSGVRSHADGLFQFYLLRFRGRASTPALERLAQDSGGQAIEVGGEDPTALLEPFADALTRSQGYEAELLTPSKFELAAHRGAKRVRLLAVARGEGPELGFTIADQQGRQPPILGDLRVGRHRYQEGQSYRFAALDYRPGTTPVDIRVTGAGNDWKVVAVPEYRLFVQTEIRRGRCDAPGERIDFGTETGQTVCVLISLVNEDGQVVANDVTGSEVQARVRFGRRDAEGGPQEYPANPLGNQARFGFEYRNLEPGIWVIDPTVHLQLAGQERALTLRSSSRSLQAASIEIRPSPTQLDFGSLLPGDQPAGQGLQFSGNFATADGRIELANRGSVPACVTFTLSGKGEGEPQPISVNQPYTLAAHVAPYCGPESFQRQFESNLRLVFDGGSQYLPAVEVSLRFLLDYRIEAPERIDVVLRAGDSETLSILVDGNSTRPLELEALIEKPAERRDWPAKRNLDLGFAAPGDDQSALLRADGEIVRAQTAKLGVAELEADAAPFALRLTSDACCPGGDYFTQVGLRPADDQELYSLLGAPLRPILIPVTVTVEGSGLWACRGPLILAAIGLLLLLLLILYLVSMVRHTHLLSRERLADRLVPLRWDSFGNAVPHGKSKHEVHALVRRGMPFGRRLQAWLKANPLVIGLPGKSYDETVELMLQPEQRADRSRVALVTERDHLGRLRANPEQGLARLFASSRGRGVKFYAVPRRGRIGRLVPERLYDVLESDDQAKAAVLELRRREQLIHSIEESEREEGRAAGWRLG